MNRKLYKTIVLKNESVRLDYYIIKELKTLEEEKSAVYGLEINQSPISTFSLFGYMNSRVEDITTDYEKVADLAKVLTEAEADPACLFDFVSDMVEEGEV